MTTQPSDRGSVLLFQSLRENLRYYRTRAGYSQRQVAEYLGLSRPAYTYYETGKSTPSAADLARLAGLYAIRMEDFFAPPAGGHSPGQTQKKRR